MSDLSHASNTLRWLYFTRWFLTSPLPATLEIGGERSSDSSDDGHSSSIDSNNSISAKDKEGDSDVLSIINKGYGGNMEIRRRTLECLVHPEGSIRDEEDREAAMVLLWRLFRRYTVSLGDEREEEEGRGERGDNEVENNEGDKTEERAGEEGEGEETILKIMLRSSMRRAGRRVCQAPLNPNPTLNLETKKENRRELKWESLFNPQDLDYFNRPTPSTFISNLMSSFL